MRKKILFSNGCFDIIHRGHLELLKTCREVYPEYKIVVGLNSDVSVKRLKGDSRPINEEKDRKFLLESLKYVDEVVIFDQDTPYELIKKIQPDLIVKGGDYQKEEVAGHDICPVVIFKCFNKDGEKVSSSGIIEKVRNTIDKEQN
jgi:D-beta-D-heptose 7-phosphate kinase/D-beta-D-heptose 1-phosphate adenosyltransferase